ncbi:SHOCT domain-containing protein [Streptomyces sp. NPDC006879]|uniref:SHOCT domain-containing protein n=1 Tax=Streptomyces sp. NPDC006879 TaxID=3364767 RepID=UPI0036AEE2CE
MFWPHQGMGAWSWVAMSFTLVLVVALATAVVCLFLRNADRLAGPTGPRATPSARQLLAQRLARGEIDEEEFERLLMVLRKHEPGRSGSGVGDG